MTRPLAHVVAGLLFALFIGCTAVNGSASVVPASGATFQVSLHYDFGNGQTDVQRCAGALVSDVWVVTSATCLCSGNLQTCNTDVNRWLIHFGSNVLSTTSVLGVSQIVVNPNWTGNVTDGWDVALFRLSASVNTVRPNMVSLALPGSYEWTCQDQNVNVYVWGNQFANQLVVAPAVIAGDWLIYATRQFLNSVADATAQVLALWQCFKNPNCDASAIAITYLDSNVGLCNADIGAPVVGTTANGQLVLLGVASYRFSGNGIVVDPTRPCVDTYRNGSRVPVVFTQIDQSDAWITSVVGNPTVLTSVCGDGRIGPAEQCDDGNTISGDGCSNVCLLEQDWFCTPASAQWVDSDDSDDDHSASNHVLRWLFQVDFCTRSTCHRMAHDDDDDGSSGSIIALIIVLSIVGGLIILAIIIFCIIRRRKRRNAGEVPAVVPVEPIVPIVPMAPMISIPASPIMMQAPPSTPAQGVVIDTWSAHALPPVIQQEVATPVQLDIVTPTYGASYTETLPPIVQREDIIEPPRLEQTAVVGPPTWLKD